MEEREEYKAASRKKLWTSFILLARLDTKKEWHQVNNPSDSDVINAARFLSNEFNEYLEYKNTGIIYRWIRQENLGEYL